MEETIAELRPPQVDQARNPFPGLRPFDVNEADLFFGRDTENYAILQRLAITHFLAVIGNSGCGKSSLVKAGVIAALQDGHMAGGGRWRVASLRPGNQPVRNLSAALSETFDRNAGELEQVLRKGSLGILEAAGSGALRADDKLLILVDQFEELFQYVTRENTRPAQEEVKAFIKLLLSAASSHEIPVYVMLTMRSEYLGLCGGYVGLAEAINEGIYLVPQMTRQQFQDTITEPIRDAGCTIPDFLVDRILNDLTTQSDQLPLLQHTLMRMWQRKGSRISIELDDYIGVGEIANCLNGHADSVYDALTPRQKEIVQSLFRTITELTPANRKVRNPCSVELICKNAGASLAEVSEVAGDLSTRDRCFLFIPREPLTPGTLIDISHEALIRKWVRLDSWVMDEGRVTGLLRTLEDSARRWRDFDGNNEEKTAFLYRGAQLRETEDMLKVRGNRFTENQLNFIRKSQAARRSERVRRNILWVVIAALLVIVSGYAYWDQADKAKTLRTNAGILQSKNDELQTLKQKLVAALQQTSNDRRNSEAAKLAGKAVIQAEPARQISNGITIQYFAKQAELESNKDLIPSWRRLGFNVDQKGAQYELPSNKIWYGSKVDLQSVQTVAYTLLENGIALRIIEPLSKSGLDQGRERVIQVGWSGMAANLPLLTPDDVKKFEFVKQSAFSKEQSTAPPEQSTDYQRQLKK